MNRWLAITLGLALLLGLGSFGFWMLGDGPEGNARSGLLHVPEPAGTTGEELALPRARASPIVSTPFPAAREDASQGLILKGRILSARNRYPLPGTRVHVGPITTLEACRGSQCAAGTDGEGRFAIGDLTIARDTTLGIDHWDHALTLVPIGQRSFPGVGTVDLGDLLAEPGAAIWGRVVAAGDGAGIPDALVLQAARWSLEHAFIEPLVLGRTLPNGAFRFEHLFVDKARSLVLIAIGRDCAAVSVSGANGTEPLTLRAEPGIRAVITVQSPDGRPIAGARVAAAPPLPTPYGIERPIDSALVGAPAEIEQLFVRHTDARGEARLPLVLFGGGQKECDIVVTADGRKAGRLRLRRSACGPDFEGVIRLAAVRRVAISGRVIDARGLPVAGAQVMASVPSMQAVRSAGDGSFRLYSRTLEAIEGGVELAALHPTFVGARTTVNFQGDNDVTDVVISMKRGRSVAGILKDDAGNSIDGGVLRLMTFDRDAPPSVDTRSVSGGTFDFHVEDGWSWEIRVLRVPDAQDFVAELPRYVLDERTQSVEIVVARRR